MDFYSDQPVSNECLAYNFLRKVHDFLNGIIYLKAFSLIGRWGSNRNRRLQDRTYVPFWEIGRTFSGADL